MNLYHVKDESESFYIFADSISHAIERYRGWIEKEFDADSAVGNLQSVILLAEESEIMLPPERSTPASAEVDPLESDDAPIITSVPETGGPLVRPDKPRVVEYERVPQPTFDAVNRAFNESESAATNQLQIAERYADIVRTAEELARTIAENEPDSSARFTVKGTNKIRAAAASFAAARERIHEPLPVADYGKVESLPTALRSSEPTAANATLPAQSSEQFSLTIRAADQLAEKLGELIQGDANTTLRHNIGLLLRRYQGCRAILERGERSVVKSFGPTVTISLEALQAANAVVVARDWRELDVMLEQCEIVNVAAPVSHPLVITVARRRTLPPTTDELAVAPPPGVRPAASGEDQEL